MKPVEYLPPIPPKYKPIDGLDSLADGFADHVHGRLLAPTNDVGKSVGWFAWDGTVWKRSEPDAKRELQDYLRFMWSTNGGNEELEKVLKEAMKFPSRILDWAAVNPRLSIPLERFDADPYMLNTPDGVYDLRDGRLHVHEPDLLMSQITAVSAAEDSTEWDTRLAGGSHGGQPVQGILHDTEKREYVRGLFGMAMFGEVHQNLFPVLIGSGGNGKGAMYETIHATLGGYSFIMSPKMIEGSQLSSADYELANLRGARFVFMSETRRGKVNTAIVKQMTGGDPISVRQIYGEPFTIPRPSWSIFLVTNHTPIPDTVDGGYARRLRLVEYPEKFVDGAAVDGAGVPGGSIPIKTYFRDRLAPQVLRWLIDAAVDYHQNGLPETPRSVLDPTETALAEADSMGRFVDDCLTIGGPGSRALVSKIYSEYKGWCDDNAELKLSLIEFGSELKRTIEERSQGMPQSHRPAKKPYSGRMSWLRVGIKAVDAKQEAADERYSG